MVSIVGIRRIDEASSFSGTLRTHLQRELQFLVFASTRSQCVRTGGPTYRSINLEAQPWIADYRIAALSESRYLPAFWGSMGLNIHCRPMSSELSGLGFHPGSPLMFPDSSVIRPISPPPPPSPQCPGWSGLSGRSFVAQGVFECFGFFCGWMPHNPSCLPPPAQCRDWSGKSRPAFLWTSTIIFSCLADTPTLEPGGYLDELGTRVLTPSNGRENERTEMRLFEAVRFVAMLETVFGHMQNPGPR